MEIHLWSFWRTPDPHNASQHFLTPRVVGQRCRSPSHWFVEWIVNCPMLLLEAEINKLRSFFLIYIYTYCIYLYIIIYPHVSLLLFLGGGLRWIVDEKVLKCLHNSCTMLYFCRSWAGSSQMSCGRHSCHCYKIRHSHDSQHRARYTIFSRANIHIFSLHYHEPAVSEDGFVLLIHRRSDVAIVLGLWHANEYRQSRGSVPWYCDLAEGLCLASFGIAVAPLTSVQAVLRGAHGPMVSHVLSAYFCAYFCAMPVTETYWKLGTARCL